MADKATKSQAHAFARSDRTKVGQWWWTVDHVLLGATCCLILIGVFLSFGASPAAAARKGLGDPFYYAIRQCVFAGLGVSIMVSTSMLSPKGVRRVAFFIFIGAIALMMALPFIGHASKGATRWIALGGMTLQPSEFMKPALIVLCGWMFAEGQKKEGVPGTPIAFALYALSVALLLIQPDVGQTILITVAFGAAFFMAGVPLRWIFGLAGLAVAGGISLYFIFDHVASRVQRFLAADDGSGGHQVDKALDAIAAGGLFGRGPGEGQLKRHVPEMQTDFVYSVGAEEYGLVFSLLLIGLFALLVVRGMMKAMKLSDTFEQISAAALFVLVGQQAIINVAVNLNLMPTKGMTLPFISYGGSSMLAMGLTVGLALALTRRRPGAYANPQGLSPAGAFA
ncbi:MAG TPA: putative lipid II flippase FtsW [Caulobacteraceae bacterium]|jgi:cell division protein FtsW